MTAAEDWDVLITHPADLRGTYGPYTHAEAEALAAAYRYPQSAFPGRRRPAGALRDLIIEQEVRRAAS